MSQIFPPWSNRLPIYLAAGVLAFALLAAGAVTYYFSPEYTDVGYRPRQPVPFSHKLHAGELGMDCRYCHVSVEVSAVASIPPTRLCMNCHQLVARNSEKVALLQESAATGQPIHWVRVHKVPDYAYFNHSVHVHAGVECSTCHGEVTQMEQITQVEPLSMGWCLDCHRQPPGRAGNLNPSTDCSACHR